MARRVNRGLKTFIIMKNFDRFQSVLSDGGRVSNMVVG